MAHSEKHEALEALNKAQYTINQLELQNADLLAALKKAFDSWYDDPRHIEVKEPKWVDQARAAIERAEAS